MQQVPQKAPLPCFGLEHNRSDPMCQACPHFDNCLAHMGSRADKIPLDRLHFDILPDTFKRKISDDDDIEDPELPHLQRLYTDCFASVFHRNPTDNVGLYKHKIALNARRAACSLRMFMLANMVAHEVHEKAVVDHTEKQRTASFRVKLLTSDLSIKRAETYQEMCADRFGTFTLKSLDVLSDEDRPDSDTLMEHNETVAALWLVRFKIHRGLQHDPSLLALYAAKEFDLDPEWLALEDNYTRLILDPHMKKHSGTEAMKRHRYNVIQVLGHYKKHPALARYAWLSRQTIMPVTVGKVLTRFGYAGNDFLYSREPIRNSMDFWMELGLTIRHNQCWRFLEGVPSVFGPRRNETLVRRDVT